jgi:hypothetical protein
VTWKTEYRTVVIDYRNDLEQQLNTCALDGWRYIDVTTIHENDIPVSVLILARVFEEE